MVAFAGIYQNEFVKLDSELKTDKPIKAIITFLEDIQSFTKEETLQLSDFSFFESQNNLKNVNGSLNETIIEERRKY